MGGRCSVDRGCLPAFLAQNSQRTAAPVAGELCPVSLPCRTYRQKREKSVRVLAHHPSAEIHLLRHSRTGSVQAPACRFAFGNREMNGCKPSRPAMTRRPDRSHARNRSDRLLAIYRCPTIRRSETCLLGLAQSSRPCSRFKLKGRLRSSQPIKTWERLPAFRRGTYADPTLCVGTSPRRL